MVYTLSDLSHLIKSLSKIEKRRFAQLYGAGTLSGRLPLYLQLYHVLERNESELSKLIDSNSPQAYTTAKKRLFHNLMNCLRDVHRKDSVVIVIHNYLTDIEILYDRNLSEQGLYLLQKAHRLATDNEQFDLLVQLLQWEARLNITLQHPARSVTEIMQDEKEVLNKLQQVVMLRSIYNKAKDIKKHYGLIKKDVEQEVGKETIHQVGMIPLSACLSDTARFYCYSIHALFRSMIFEHNKAYKYSQHLIKPGMHIVMANDYINGILDHIFYCVCSGQFEQALEALVHAKSYIQNQKWSFFHTLNVQFFYIEANFLLVLYQYTGNYSMLQETIAMTEPKIELYRTKLSFEMKHILTGNLMNAYLAIGDFQKMDASFATIFSHISQSIRVDLNADLYLVKIFMLLQHKIYDVLPSAALSAYRYYTQTRQFRKRFDLELKMIAVLRRNDLNLEDPGQRYHILEKLKMLLNDYIRSLGKGNNFQEHYSRYVIWCNSLISEKPYHEEAFSWYQQHKLHQSNYGDRV